MTLKPDWRGGVCGCRVRLGLVGTARAGNQDVWKEEAVSQGILDGFWSLYRAEQVG